MASLLSHFWLLGSLKIQVDNDESWGGRQGEKGCLLWYLSIILNPAFIELYSSE